MSSLFGAAAPVILYVLVMEITQMIQETAAGRTAFALGRPEIFSAMVTAVSVCTALAAAILSARPDIRAAALRESAAPEPAKAAGSSGAPAVLRVSAYFIGLTALAICANALSALIPKAGGGAVLISPLPAGLAIAVYGVLVPFAEETVFRAILMPRLVLFMHSKRLMFLLSALLFAVWHGGPLQIAYAFAAGLLLAGAYAQLGGLLPAFALHAAANIVTIVCAGAGMFRAGAQLVPWAACGLAAAAVSAVMLLRE